MPTFLAPHADRIYAAYRIVVGLLFTCHGAQKIFGVFGGVPPEAPAFVVWFAGGIELVGGALVMVGLRAGWAAFLCSGTMAVAYFTAHQPQGLFPIENGGELAALYSFAFLLIAVRGSGTWSVDGSR
jgi:putative oxidoreductase